MNITDESVWKVLKDTRRPIIIYGTGNGADKILRQMHKNNIHIYGIMASNDFVRGQSFQGHIVRRLSDFETEADDPIIIIAFGSQRKEVIDNILSIAKKHTVLCADVPVYGSNIFDIDFYNDNKEKISEVCSLLADEQSKRVFENIINFKLSGRLSYLTDSFTEKSEVFGNILCFDKSESFLDLGAYRGDTIEEFLSCTNGAYSHITALEPDKKTFLKLREYAGNMKDTQLFNMGIWCEDADLNFEGSLGRGSSIKRDGTQYLPVTKIDTLYKKRKVTYIKLDVEGAEEQALLGGKEVIRRDAPKINMALYHRGEDIFKLPLLLNDIQPHYRIYIRQHPHIPAWDLNLYAVPDTLNI